MKYCAKKPNIVLKTNKYSAENIKYGAEKYEI